jgi:hypothetical protein
LELSCLCKTLDHLKKLETEKLKHIKYPHLTNSCKKFSERQACLIWYVGPKIDRKCQGWISLLY